MCCQMKELHAEDAQVVEAIDGSCATDTPQSGLAEVLECQEVSVRVSLKGLHVQEVYNTHFQTLDFILNQMRVTFSFQEEMKE